MAMTLLRAALTFAAASLARRPPAEALNATIATDGLSVRHGVAYGPASRQAMDVWRPEGAAVGLPVVVFFYGGAWQGGRRQDYRFVAATLARRGMVVVVPDYRLFPQVRFPTFIEDAALAVAAVRRAAPGWGGDADRVFLAGHSAGAHIAAMLTLAPRFLAAAGEDRAHLAGMVGLAGPYDFLPILDEDIRAVFASAADPRETQPVAHVDGHNPPMLLLHGGADRTCYPRNSLALAARVRAAGGAAEARIAPGVGHIGIVLGFAPLFGFRSSAVEDVAVFVLGDGRQPGVGAIKRARNCSSVVL
jgi:acetyl esterase/lipase